MKLLPISDYIAVVKAVPGILATILSGNLGNLNQGANRDAIISAADLALTHQVPGAAALPESFRKQLIGSVLDGLLKHAQMPA